MRLTLRRLFLSPVQNTLQWAIVGVVALAFVFMPQLPPPSDWARNTADLVNGLAIYHNPGYVYPPWALILLWPYRLMTAPGSRFLSTLAAGWLVARRGWSLREFAVIVFSPFYLWTMTLSNADALVLIFPVALWEAVGGTRWEGIGRGLALAVLLVKPQASWLVILLLVWGALREIRQDGEQMVRRWLPLATALGIAGLIVVPISLVGRPPLIVQFWHNVTHPSAVNREFWALNNVSITEIIGIVGAVALVAAALAGLYVVMRWRGREWSESHQLGAAFLASMLISPYTSNQSVIAALAMTPTLWSLLIQYAVVFGGTALGIYLRFDAWWTLVIGLAALWLFVQGKQQGAA